MLSGLAQLPLEERTVRFFTFLTGNIPMLGDNPLMGVLMRRLGPMLVDELRKLDEDTLMDMYRAMLLSLGQVVAPGARGIVIDLQQEHVLLDAVDYATNAPVVDAEAALMADIDAELASLAPPPPPLPEVVEDAEPMIGVELPDGTIVAMKQSEALAMRAKGAQQ